MTLHEEAILQLLQGKELSARHPNTCVNPDKWFIPVAVNIYDSKVWVSGSNTCWFAISMCEVRDTRPNIAYHQV